jgi:hypothetical protein
MYNPSPREVFLEYEVKRMKGELEYLRRLNEAPTMSLLYEPEVIAKALTANLQIYLTAETVKDEMGYHVRVTDLTKPMHYKAGYYVDGIALMKMNEASKADMMMQMSQDLVFKVGRDLWAK